MPWWDEPEIADEIAAILGDLETVDSVLADLPPGSADWHLADGRSIDIGDRLDIAVRRAEWPGGAPGPSTPSHELLERAHGAMARSGAMRRRASDAAAATARRDRPRAVLPA
jgi:hypothetical protein